jgi:hypothetical protein
MKALVDSLRKKLSGFERDRLVAEVVEAAMLAEGAFYATPGGDLHYFHLGERRLYPLPSSELAAHIYTRFGINRAEHLFNYVEQHLVAHALRQGQRTEVYRLVYYDKGRGLLYIHNLAQGVYRLDGSQIEEVPNGTDGVLFISQPWHEPFTMEPPSDLLAPLLIERPNFQGAPSLSVVDCRALYSVWLLSIFFESLQYTKPLLLFRGPQGSGKGTALKMVGTLLFGRHFNVTGIRRDKEDAFDAAICNNYFVVFDNVDTGIPWLEDKLAVTATGQAIRLRRLYTTNEEALYWPRCFLALTSRTPRFRRADVADRLLPFSLARLHDFAPEPVLLGEILNNRGALWGELLEALNRVVAVLRQGIPNYTGSFRLADWAALAVVIGEAIGMGSEIPRLLGAVQGAQHEFATEEDLCASALSRWLRNPGNIGRWVKADELNKELSSPAVWQGLPWPYANGRALAQHLEALWSALEQRFGGKRVPGQGGVYRYAFARREDEPAEEQEATSTAD